MLALLWRRISTIESCFFGQSTSRGQRVGQVTRPAGQLVYSRVRHRAQDGDAIDGRFDDPQRNAGLAIDLPFDRGCSNLLFRFEWLESGDVNEPDQRDG